MPRNEIVHNYQNQSILQRIWSWLTLPIFTIAKIVFNYISDFIVKHKGAFMPLAGVVNAFARVSPQIALVSRATKLVLPVMVLKKNGTLLSAIWECIRTGNWDLQSFCDKFSELASDTALSKARYALTISGSCFCIWIGASIAERQIMELAIFLGILLLILFSRSISLLLFAILIAKSTTPFLWILKTRCRPNDPINLVFDSTLLIVTTCSCMIDTPFANKIIISFDKENQLNWHSLFALKEGLKGILSIFLVWACNFSPLMLVRSLFLTLGVYQLYEIVCSCEALLLLQDEFLKFWNAGSSTWTLGGILKGVCGVIVKLQGYLKGQDAPSKNVLLCVALARIILGIGLALTVISKCGNMVFTGLCLLSFCLSRMEDFYILGSVVCRRSVLDTLPERFLFCFNVFPSRKGE